MDEQKKLEEKEQRKDQIRNELPGEPDADDPDVIKIMLKLPNGTRLERRFLKTQSLKVSYDRVLHRYYVILCLVL